jgi:CRISPR system Cascade subunit CasE
LAKRKPKCPHWCPSNSFSLKEISPTFLTHQYYAFDLRANPVRTIEQHGPDGETLYKSNGKRRSGKRVPLVDQDELRAWLINKGETRCREPKTGQDVSGGFQIIEERPFDISPMVESHFRKKGKRNGKTQAAYHGGVQFRGVLEVTDQEAFVKTYQSGIGSAKSFGFGLLLLAPTRL